MKNHYACLALMASIFLFGCSEENDSEPMPLSVPSALDSTEEATDTEGNRYQVGFNQVSAINQDPFVRKSTAAGETLWYLEHEKSEVDGRATHIFIDADDMPWVVFSVVGGSYSEAYITERELASEAAFGGVYQGDYGNGGGPQVSIVARLNPDTGKIEKASYVTARKTDGKTNGLKIKSLGMVDGKIAFDAEAVAWPPTIGSSYERYPDITDEDRVDGVFNMYYEMDTDLKQIITAELQN
ncbi:hypothetical protein [Maribacter sp. 2-571]|uniref:hypothetical protein n=1 Tax=Maribacter sp. 2-571 TaxID=3417569 RepID=UPI003D33CFD4